MFKWNRLKEESDSMILLALRREIDKLPSIGFEPLYLFSEKQVREKNEEKEEEEEEKEYSLPLFVCLPEIKRDNKEIYKCPSYSRERDIIYMPEKNRFFSSKGYYHALFHEIIHSTAKRLKRERPTYWGSSIYAKEELIAEIGASLLDLNSCILFAAGYLKVWILELENQIDIEKIYYEAERKAIQAVEFLYGL